MKYITSSVVCETVAVCFRPKCVRTAARLICWKINLKHRPRPVKTAFLWINFSTKAISHPGKKKQNKTKNKQTNLTIKGLDTFNTLRPRQNGRHFANDIFKCIFLNKIVSIAIEISLKFVPKGPINNIPALVQIMAWRRSGDKPLSEPMMVSLLTHICVARPQWVKSCLQHIAKGLQLPQPQMISIPSIQYHNQLLCKIHVQVFENEQKTSTQCILAETPRFCLLAAIFLYSMSSIRRILDYLFSFFRNELWKNTAWHFNKLL